ncbi:hypothetical protein HSBAA_08340 [Vreelandella sulfidaeris]|uniref:Methyltransferase domain-containing protein n=1 Tax=Vreelandella sulfidaeris TaxID=115553 RepID=A0A455U5E7_9GAMM|nr:hypothetical protein HSBAA_08340 [Halomonas sulfidaeris]
MFNTTAWNRLRYTAYAPFYDTVAARAFRRPRRIALGQVDWEPGMRVLLVGAGTGLDLPFLPCDIELHATDIAPAMVKRIAKELKRCAAMLNAALWTLKSLTTRRAL